jgi:hypothetical protein
VVILVLRLVNFVAKVKGARAWKAKEKHMAPFLAKEKPTAFFPASERHMRVFQVMAGVDAKLSDNEKRLPDLVY